MGSNLALTLAEEGHDVVITGHVNEQKLPNFKGKIHYTGAVGIDWNALGAVDAVFHQAANADTTIYDRDEMLRANVDFSKTLFTYAAEHGARHIVYASSTAVYGNLPAPYKESGPIDPLNPYAESKALLETFANTFGAEHPSIRIVGLRYSNVYGPRENHKGKMASMVYQLAQQILKGNPKIFKMGEQKREYVYVRDVVRANKLALQATENCVVNCATGRARTFNELVATLTKTLNLPRDTIYIDNPYGAKYQSHIECDVSLAKEKLGFVAEYDLERGIADYAASGFLTA